MYFSQWYATTALNHREKNIRIIEAWTASLCAAAGLVSALKYHRDEKKRDDDAMKNADLPLLCGLKNTSRSIPSLIVMQSVAATEEKQMKRRWGLTSSYVARISRQLFFLFFLFLTEESDILSKTIKLN